MSSASPTIEELTEVQMQIWPDSKVVDIRHVMNNWCQEEYDQATFNYWVNECKVSIEQAVIAAERTRLRNALTNSRLVVMALANSKGPLVFYECCFVGDKPRYRGIRYGLKASEYLSGFHTPDPVVNA